MKNKMQPSYLPAKPHNFVLFKTADGKVNITGEFG